jgi:hypothetical protein
VHWHLARPHSAAACLLGFLLPILTQGTTSHRIWITRSSMGSSDLLSGSKNVTSRPWSNVIRVM